MVEGARLERVYTAMYRRFESSRFRQEVKKTRKGVFYFFEEEKRIRAQGSHGAIATKKDTTEAVPFLNNIFIQT